jgi:addiction module HigA family antidote
MVENEVRPVHPGEVLREEFLSPMNMTVPTLAVALCLPQLHVEEIAQERQGVSADVALRLSRYFGTTPEFWLNLQMAYDLRTAVMNGWERIQSEIEPFNAA